MHLVKETRRLREIIEKTASVHLPTVTVEKVMICKNVPAGKFLQPQDSVAITVFCTVVERHSLVFSV